MSPAAAVHGAVAISLLPTGPRALDIVYSAGADSALRHVSLAALETRAAASAAELTVDAGGTSPLTRSALSLSPPTCRRVYVADGRGGVLPVDPWARRPTAGAGRGWNAQSRPASQLGGGPCGCRASARHDGQRASGTTVGRAAAVGGERRRWRRRRRRHRRSAHDASGCSAAQLLVTSQFSLVHVWAWRCSPSWTALIEAKTTVAAAPGVGAAGAATTAVTVAPSFSLFHLHDWPSFLPRLSRRGSPARTNGGRHLLCEAVSWGSRRGRRRPRTPPPLRASAAAVAGVICPARRSPSRCTLWIALSRPSAAAGATPPRWRTRG